MLTTCSEFFQALIIYLQLLDAIIPIPTHKDTGAQESLGLSHSCCGIASNEPRSLGPATDPSQNCLVKHFFSLCNSFLSIDNECTVGGVVQDFQGMWD